MKTKEDFMPLEIFHLLCRDGRSRSLSKGALNILAAIFAMEDGREISFQTERQRIRGGRPEHRYESKEWSPAGETWAMLYRSDYRLIEDKPKRTVDDVLSSLSEEDKKIVQAAMKGER